MSTDLVNSPAQALDRPSPQRVEELLGAFVANYDAKQSSKALYRRVLRQYFNWVNKKGYLLSQIAREHILEYKDELLGSGISSLTVAAYLTAVKVFYTWAEASKFYPNVARGVKLPKREQKYQRRPLSLEQSKALVSYCKTIAPRDAALINLLHRTGLRLIEAARSNIGDIDQLEGKRILWVQGKGRDAKDKYVVLTDKAYLPLAQYLKTRKKTKKDEPLFVSVSNNSLGRRLSTREISHIAKAGLQAIGIDSRAYTAHSLRHTTAVSILRAGGRLEDAQGVLRHSNSATTQGYLKIFEEEMRLKNAPEELLDSLY